MSRLLRQSSLFLLLRSKAAYSGPVCAAIADLPVEFQTTLELWINLKTAKTLGLKISPTFSSEQTRSSSKLSRGYPVDRFAVDPIRLQIMLRWRNQ